MITETISLDSSVSLSLKPADLARARDAIDGASITPLNLSIGGSSAPGLECDRRMCNEGGEATDGDADERDGPIDRSARRPRTAHRSRRPCASDPIISVA